MQQDLSRPHLARFYSMALAIVISLACAAMAIFNFTNKQYNIAVNDWQARLNIIADSRASDVQRWVMGHFAELSSLANNASLQLYVGELEAPADAEPGEDLAQQTYLRHLLTLTAERGGFTLPDAADAIPANVSRSASGGLAVLDKSGNVIAATSQMPPVEGDLAQFVATAEKGKQALYDIRAKGDGTLEMGFLVPIYAVQGDMTPSAQIGAVLGVKTVGQDLFALLQQPGTTEETLGAWLLRAEGRSVVYLNPMPSSPALSLKLDDTSGKLAESFALRHTGQFALQRDYQGNDLLFTSRPIAGTPWVLMEKIHQDEALANARDARNSQLVILLLVALAVFAGMVAAWRGGTSRNAIRLSEKLTRSIEEIRLREEVLKLVTENHPGAIFLLDGQNRIRYANEAMAERCRMEEADLLHKDLNSVLGTAEAEPYRHAGELALENASIISWTRVEQDEDGDEIYYQANHIPVPDASFEDGSAMGILVVEEDITLLLGERERRERVLNQLTKSLVKVMDKRDPFASNHSAKVALLARAVAEELQLEPQDIEATATAGQLMNIGKITVPEKVLTKSQGLDAAERKVIEDSLLTSADMLADVEFDGPVVETLRQALEHVDGSGPRGLKGEQILLSARIIAAVNAFVAMTNPRAYRKALNAKQAQDVLLSQVEKEFDRKVVIALVNLTENRQKDLVSA